MQFYYVISFKKSGVRKDCLSVALHFLEDRVLKSVEFEYDSKGDGENTCLWITSQTKGNHGIRDTEKRPFQVYG